ncbi:MAG: M55 family metallopeptidase [Ignavibacteriales bacterium]|nr:M55 family metallopeptidase [Ignavibacteriales bacterium]
MNVHCNPKYLALLLLVTFFVSSALFAQPKKLKVYISVDMEGVVGTVTEDQLGPAGFEYARFREFMTREALAAVNAAKEAGATEILISDSHGNGENLLIDLFPKDVRIIRAWPRHLAMMAGIDNTFDAVLFIGYHSSTNNMKGVRAHTFSSARLTRVALNGTEVTEGAFNAAIAGHFGVPVIMMSGDDAAIEEVRSLVGNIEGAETKKTLGFHSANTITPEASYELIGQKVKAALKRLKDFKPYVVKSPVTVEVSFKSYRPVEALSYLKVIERTNSHTIRFQGKDMMEISDFMEFLTTYNIAIEP